MFLTANTELKNGEYRILDCLGQGGFGITYLAHQVRLNRKVVIKEFYIKEYCDRDRDTLRVTLGTSGSGEMVARFLDKFLKEALNIAALKHSNIISIHDVFEENNTAYYVMEYHGAGSLGSLVDIRGALGKEDALYYVRQVASALGYIHSRRMMHLDVKPDNILIDDEGNAVLIDFGLAKVYQEGAGDNGNRPRTSSIATYSPGYAPLEQYNPSGVTSFSPATDIYSLGATLFTLLTGECPPMAMELLDNSVLIAKLERCGVERRLTGAIAKSMSPMKEARPQSVDEFLALLDAQPAAGSSSRPTQPMAKSGGGVSRPTQPMVKSGGVSRPTEPMNNGGGVSRPTAPMNNNGAATADNEPKKPFNWKVPAGVVAAILCLVFAGVGINNCNNERAEQERLAIIEKARRDSIATARKAAEDKRISDSIANELRNAFLSKNFTVNGVSFTMVAVAGGTFNMGSNDSEVYDWEKPVHSVTLSDYYIGETEVTQALWEAVMGNNPSYFNGSSNPVECVSYNECKDFINKLNTLLSDQLPAGRKFRLPTEAEWEFAARGGNKGKNNNYTYSGSNNIDAVAWWGYDKGNSNKRTHPVKQKQPNELGLYDMSGNVWEWCYDWYGNYSSASQSNPQGPSSGSWRVLRGGSWNYFAQFCRVAYRNSNTPAFRSGESGLRLAF